MFARFRSFVRSAVKRSAFEREMDDELRFHLEQRADDLVRRGLPRDAAIRRARLEFGNPEAYQERCREAKKLHLMDDVRLDLRFAARMIRRDAPLSAAVIATVALGIGATTAAFSVVNAVLLRPLPYPEPDRLVVIGSSSGELTAVFGPDFLEWRAGCRVCDEIGAYSYAGPGSLTGGTEPQRVRIGHVTESFFSTMGVQPILGRTFLPEDTGRPMIGSSPQSVPVTAVILSHRLWRAHFGANPDIVGSRVIVEGDPCTVVGVMPEGFAFPADAQAWVPATVNTRRDNAFLRVIARVKPEVVPAQVQADLQALAQRLNADAFEQRRHTSIGVVSLQDYVVGGIRPALLVFFGAVGLVLVIACANVANLLLAQAAARPKEIAIRTALGAGTGRIVRQLLTESVVLAVLGGALGLALAIWFTRVFVALAPSDVPRVDGIGVDRWMFGFGVLLSVVTGLLFGLAPAARTAKPDVHRTLQDADTRTAAAASRGGIRKVLVAIEVALASVLLIGGGLLMRSFVELRRTPIGFDPAQTLTATVTLPDASYPTAAHVRAYVQTAIERLSALADVRAVGVVNALPLGRDGARIGGDLLVDGEAQERRGAWARKLAVGGDYFRAVGIPLVRGRLFDSGDTENAPGAVIVSESLARRLWPNADPLGHRVNSGFTKDPWPEVVGVVGDTKQDEIGERPTPAFYQPYDQIKDARRWFLAEMTFVVRTGAPPEAAATAVRATLSGVDNALPVYSVLPMPDVIAQRTVDPRFYTTLLLSFSLAALTLAVAGIYGLVSYSVAQRTREIGIRIALGARVGEVVGMLVREGMGLVAAGALAGVACALLATRLLSRFLYGVTPTDATTFVVIPLLLGLVAVLACYVPARRATRIDPLTALRHE
jgi:putative ABC transport system permease protein